MVSLIVAHAHQHVIGFKNQMPWHLPNDLKHVKAITSGHTIVMGRKTFESLGKPLPNRTNVILTRNTKLDIPGVSTVHTVKDIQSLPGKVFIFGGAHVYRETSGIVNEMFVTEIDARFGGDTFFPEYNKAEWEIVDSQEGTVDANNIYPHRFLHLRRK